MRIWIDTEFNDDALISMALIAENGLEWYEVLECLNPGQWVAENVMPRLDKTAIGAMLFTSRLYEFLGCFDTIHVIADWPKDIAFFCNTLILGLGIRMNTPPLTMEVIRLDGVSADPHNALADARGFKAAHLASEAKRL